MTQPPDLTAARAHADQGLATVDVILQGVHAHIAALPPGASRLDAVAIVGGRIAASPIGSWVEALPFALAAAAWDLSRPPTARQSDTEETP